MGLSTRSPPALKDCISISSRPVFREFSNALGDVAGARGPAVSGPAWAIREAASSLLTFRPPMMPLSGRESWQVPGTNAAWFRRQLPKLERDCWLKTSVTLVVQVNGQETG